MDVSLKGKVALVTGASRGIGLAIAKSFAESGASVMMVSRKIDESAMEGIDGEVAIRPANVGDPTAAAAVVRETIAKFGRLDILVNNAATNPYYGPTMGVDEGRYDKTFQINLKAPLQWTQAAYEASFKENPGVIINIAQTAVNATAGAVVISTAPAVWPSNATGLVRPGALAVEGGWCRGQCVASVGPDAASGAPCGRIDWGAEGNWTRGA